MDTLLEKYRSIIAQGIQETTFPDTPKNLYDPVRYILQNGGKRIRPLLVLMAADLYGDEKLALALPAALAVELFHNFTLMHDDIMDEAPLRRGMSTVHEKWDTNVAILAGDNLMVLAYQQLAKCPVDKIPVLLNIFNQMAQGICEGQQLDVEFETQYEVKQEDYIEMIRLKTALLLGSALKMGGLIGDASHQDAEHLYDFGIHVGIAFQLQDDILDVFGDPSVFGKQLGGDILSNKKTILLIRALKDASPDLKAELASWLSKDVVLEGVEAENKISAITAIYNQLNVKESAILLQKKHIKAAFDSLDQISGQAEGLDKLRMLAQSLLTRIN